MVNTNVEITPGHILQHYTCTADSRVQAPNLRKQFFLFSASSNTATVTEILACIAINVPAVLGWLGVISDQYSHYSRRLQ